MSRFDLTTLGEGQLRLWMPAGQLLVDATELERLVDTSGPMIERGAPMA